MSPQPTIFGDRTKAADRLYHELHDTFGDADLCFAITPGGAHLAGPAVLATSGTLQMLDVFGLHPPLVRNASRKRVWLFDDGSLDDQCLASTAQLLQEAGAATVGVASATTGRRLKELARGAIQFVVTLAWRDEIDPDKALWSTPHPLLADTLRSLEAGHQPASPTTWLSLIHI